MTKEEFKNKYHGTSVKIEVLLNINYLISEEAKIRAERIQTMCSIMELKSEKTALNFNYITINIFDCNQQNREFKTMTEEEFLCDFKVTQGEIKFGKAKMILSKFNVKYGEISKIPNSVSNVIIDGYIQGLSSDEGSLWWHPLSGKRILFVRREGAFELTDEK